MQSLVLSELGYLLEDMLLPNWALVDVYEKERKREGGRESGSELSTKKISENRYIFV